MATYATKCLSIPIRILRLIGFDFGDPHSPWLAIATWVNLVLLVVILWPEWRFVQANLSDVQLATDGLAPLLCSLLSVAKLLTIRLKWREFRELVGWLKRLWHVTESATETSEKMLLQSTNAADNRLSLPYFVATMSVAVLYLMYPIVKSLLQLLSVGQTEWQMPMRSIFFYDIHRSPNYELTYLWFVQATILVATAAVGIDTLFYACAWNLAGHFRIVQQRFGDIELSAVAADENSQTSVLSDDFRALIQYHSRIVRLCQCLSGAYEPIMLMQFLVTSTLLCVIAYQLTLPALPLVSFVIYTTFLLAICFQCFVYCHGGTTLHVESVALADAIYASHWTVQGKCVQGAILFCLMRAQRPVQMRTIFFAANLPTFSSIISTAGSYIALLQSVSD